MATEGSSEKMEVDSINEDLDLIKYTLLSIGALQAVQHMPSVIKVEEDLTVFQKKSEILVDVSYSSGGISKMMDPSSLAESLYEPFKASRIWTNDTFRVGSSCNALLPLSPPPDGVNLLFETRNFPLFLERYKLTDQLYRVMMRQGVEPFVSMISLKNNEQKAEFYWGLTFLGKTSAFVAGILASVSSLQEIGVKNWILPTGEKVPLSSLRPTIFEVVPSHLFTIIQKISRDVEGPATYFGAQPGDHPDSEFIRFDMRKVMTTLIEEAGQARLVIRHVVLSTKLKDGTVYIVDPTGRQFGYKGANGGLIVHGRVDDYKEKFPGLVVSQYDDAPLEATGADGFIPVLKSLLVEHLKKRLCAYCGRIDEIHPKQLSSLPVDNGAGLIYTDKACKLKHCGRCKGVLYCGKVCQKLNWESHLPTCQRM